MYIGCNTYVGAGYLLYLVPVCAGCILRLVPMCAGCILRPVPVFYSTARCYALTPPVDSVIGFPTHSELLMTRA